MLKTDIISLKELITDKSKPMAALNIQADSLNRKGKGEDETFSFTNHTNSALERPHQRQKRPRLFVAIYARPEPAGNYYLKLRFSPILHTHLVLSLEQGDTKETKTELESHSESPLVGRHDRITSQTGKTASITGFIKTFETCSTIPIINADTVYDCESMGRSIILSIHNELYFKGMNHNLTPIFMMRLGGLEVYECPKLFD